MIFDKLCKYAGQIDDKRGEEILDALDRARVFEFPGVDALEYRQEPSIEAQEWLRENAFLPFPTVAVEACGQLIVVTDTKQDQLGLNREREFFVFWPMDAMLRDAGESPDAYSTKERKGGLVAHGSARLLPEGNCRERIDGGVDWLTGIGPMVGSEVFGRRYDDTPILRTNILGSYIVAFHHMARMSTPDRLLLRRSPPLRGRPAKAKKSSRRSGKAARRRVLRSHERPIYTYLHPHEVYEKMGLGHTVQAQAHRRAHERRAHVRTFRSERFKKMRGKTIVIQAAWVGPTTFGAGDHRYKVILRDQAKRLAG